MGPALWLQHARDPVDVGLHPSRTSRDADPAHLSRSARAAASVGVVCACWWAKIIMIAAARWATDKYTRTVHGRVTITKGGFEV